MKGTYRILLQSKRIKYDFEIRRNITVIRGNSGTGKTTLINMLNDYNNYGTDSGISLSCNKKCVVLSGEDWKMRLSYIKESIVFIDEGNRFIKTDEFAKEIKDTDNYYVLITREKLSALPYSVNEIYGIKCSGKYANVKQIYNEMYPIYAMPKKEKVVRPKLIITEDSNAGYDFFSCVADSKGLSCVSAKGKSEVIKYISDSKDKEALIIVDGAAFGPEMDAMVKAINCHSGYNLYTPESFEWLLLVSGIFGDFAFDSEIKEILNNPSSYIESKEYFSWERYFTYLITSTTKELKGYEYSKTGNLKEWYKQSNNVNKVLKNIEYIKFD